MRVHKLKRMTQAELEFGKLGFRRHDDTRLITYYRPYDEEDIHVDDITFCIETRKIIFYQGTELGSDAYRMDPRILKAINIQCKELGWEEYIEEGVDNELQG